MICITKNDSITYLLLEMHNTVSKVFFPKNIECECDQVSLSNFSLQKIQRIEAHVEQHHRNANSEQIHTVVSPTKKKKSSE